MRKRSHSKSPHLIWCERKTPRTGELTFGCVSCGAEISIVLPCSMRMPSVVAKQWEREHGACRIPLDRMRAVLVEALVQRGIQLGGGV